MTAQTWPRHLGVKSSRIAAWLMDFDAADEVLTSEYDGDTVTFTTATGSLQATAPFAPSWEPVSFQSLDTGPLLAHLRIPRTIGVVLARRGGYAAGVFNPNDDLVASKVGTRLVHGRHRKGGSSQARFQRRRENETSALVDDVVEVATRVLAGHELDVVVIGGDRLLLNEVFDAPSLRAYASRITPPFLQVPNPRLAVLKGVPNHYHRVRLELNSQQ